MRRLPFPSTPDFIFDTHGWMFVIPLGVVCLVAGYAGSHWVARRRFYRLRGGQEPPPTYGGWWVEQKLERSSGCLFIGLKLLGLLFLLTGLVDLVDG